MPNEDELYNAYANFLLCYIPLFEANEALKDTNMYQQDIKKASKDLERAMDKKFLTERYSCMYNSDAGAVIHMRDQLTEFYRRIVTLEPENWQIINEVVRQVKENKEWVLDRLNIVSGTSEEFSEMAERDALIQKIKNAPIAAVRYARGQIESAGRLFNN